MSLRIVTIRCRRCTRLVHNELLCLLRMHASSWWHGNDSAVACRAIVLNAHHMHTIAEQLAEVLAEQLAVVAGVVASSDKSYKTNRARDHRGDENDRLHR